MRIVRDAERDAETRRKEALLDAKEKAHEIVTDAERQARTDRQQAQALEQALARRDAQQAERQRAIERTEPRAPRARDALLADREQAASAGHR